MWVSYSSLYFIGTQRLVMAVALAVALGLIPTDYDQPVIISRLDISATTR